MSAASSTVLLEEVFARGGFEENDLARGAEPARLVRLSDFKSPVMVAYGQGAKNSVSVLLVPTCLNEATEFPRSTHLAESTGRDDSHGSKRLRNVCQIFSLLAVGQLDTI